MRPDHMAEASQLVCCMMELECLVMIEPLAPKNRIDLCAVDGRTMDSNLSWLIYEQHHSAATS